METKVLPFPAALLEEFEDIIKDHVPDSVENDSDSKDEESVIQNANHLTLKDLLHSLEQRGLHPRGFFDEDAKVLQAELDKEHYENMESKRREKKEGKKLETSQRLFQQRKALTEIALREEDEEMKRNERMLEWFLLIQNGIVPLYCRISVNDLSARSLSRLLWDDTRIVSLDLSNLNLSDTSGAFIARMLRNNRSIVKLELGDNILGMQTCSTLAESLCINNVLQYLSLESNPFAKNGSEVAEALAAMIKTNKGLRYLSLWRCSIGAESGKLIAEAITYNAKLTCLDFGYNQWQCSDINLIKATLSKNGQAHQEELTQKLDFERKETEQRALVEQQEEEKQKAAVDLKWLEDQKVERAEERRVHMESAAEIQREVDHKCKEELLKMEQQRFEDEKRKSKKKKKKKSKSTKKVRTLTFHVLLCTLHMLTLCA